MSRLVVDASVVIKWVVPESGSDDALALRRGHHLAAPDLLVGECANILRKKVKRGEVTATQAEVAARLLEQSAIELMPMRSLLRSSTDIAIRMSHPAYDCVYISLAAANGWPFVTADESLVRKFRHIPWAPSWPAIYALADASAL